MKPIENWYSDVLALVRVTCPFQGAAAMVCRGGSRYVEGCRGFPYLKKFIGFVAYWFSFFYFYFVGFLVSWFPDFLVCWFESFVVSWFQSL